MAKTIISQNLGGMGSNSDKAALQPLFAALFDRFSSQATSTAGLLIKAGGGVLAKVGSVAFAGVASGVPVAIAASTDMPALTGITITAANYNVVCFFIDSGSTVTALAGTEATTLAGVKFPTFPVGKALVGYLVITYASTFTGNSTPLDTATTVYVSPVGAFDPNLSASI